MGMRKLKIERFLKNTFNRKSNGNLISQLKIDRASQLQVRRVHSVIIMAGMLPFESPSVLDSVTSIGS